MGQSWGYYIYMYMYPNTEREIYIYTYTCIAYIYIYIYIYLFIFKFIWIDHPLSSCRIPGTQMLSTTTVVPWRASSELWDPNMATLGAMGSPGILSAKTTSPTYDPLRFLVRSF